MSKSLGNVVDPMELADRYGVDQLRYFLLREVSFGQDGSWSEDAIVTRCNADLANNFGNLAQRCLSIIAKNCDGKVPLPGELAEADETLFINIASYAATLQVLVDDQLNISAALEAIWQGMTAANVYFAEQAPWALRKSDPGRADTILYCAAEAIRRLAIMAFWAIPGGSEEVLRLLNRSAPLSFNEMSETLNAGTKLPMPQGVFPRLELSV